MSERNNIESWPFLQFALVTFLIFGTIGFCAANIKITTTPPRTIPTPAPTATLSPLFAALAEQAKARTKVTVVTTEDDSGIGLGWYAIPAGLIFTGLGVAYLGVRHGRK